MRINCVSVVRTAIFLIPAAMMLLPGEPVRAQGAALEEIVVTARRREESLMDTPVSITAFTAAEIEARQITNASDIDQSVPNLIYRTNAIQNTNASVVFIRGIGQRDFIPTVQPGVGIYIDGGYVATSIGSATELLDIESIEVLRGPQGTLFGRNTIGGAIQINTKKPHDEFEAEVSAQFGELSTQQVRGAVNIPFTDNFFGKFSAMHHARDGHVDTPNIPNDDGYGSLEVQAARAAFRWLAGDSVTVDLALDYNNRETDGVPVVLTEIFSPERGQVLQWNGTVGPVVAPGSVLDAKFLPAHGQGVNYAADYFPGDADMYMANFTLDWDISDNVSFKNITTYRNMEDFGGYDNDYSPILIGRNVDITESEQYTQEIQFSGAGLDDRLNWIAGAFFFAEETLNMDAVHFPFFGIMSGSYVENQSSALFGQFTYDFSDELSLTVGLRSSQERFDSIIDDRFQFIPELFDPSCVGVACTHQFPETFAINPDVGGGFPEVSRTRRDGYRPYPNPPHPARFPPTPGYAFNLAPNGLTEQDKDATDPYFNLAYRFSDSLMGYVSYAQGFKGGGFTQRVPPGREIDVFGPEEAQVVELGWKWQGVDNRARVTGAVFTTDYQDLQVSVTTLLGGGFSNAAAATINGFELEGLVQVTDRFQISGGIGVLDGEYDALDPAVDTFTLDSKLPNLPELQANFSGSYRFSLGSGELIARLDVSYNDEFFGVAQNNALTPSYTLTNGSIVYTPTEGNWEVAIQGTNLTDEFYTEYAFVALESSVQSMYLSPPRLISGRFTYRF